jgi:hypothetical protein
MTEKILAIVDYLSKVRVREAIGIVKKTMIST